MGKKSTSNAAREGRGVEGILALLSVTLHEIQGDAGTRWGAVKFAGDCRGVPTPRLPSEGPALRLSPGSAVGVASSEHALGTSAVPSG